MKKRILALVLALALIGSMLPVSVIAETTHQHNICADSSCTDHGAETWQPWSNATSLPTSGQYYLTTDVTLSTQVKTTGDLKLCLEGHTITATNGARHLMVGFGRTFTLTDCKGTGKLTGGTAAWGASISLDYKATFNMYGGTITGNSNTASSGGIGAIYLRPGKVSGTTHTAGGTMNMYGGTISGNTGKAAGAIYLGGNSADLLDGILNMYGGTITGNNCASGAVYTSTNAQVNLLGGAPVIKDNQGSNLNLGANGVLQVKDLETGADIHVNATTARAISSETDKDYASYFTSDNGDWDVVTAGGKLTLSSDVHKHKLCADSTCADHAAETWSPWDQADSLPTSGQYYLNTDVTLAAQVKTTGNLKLCLNGHKITATGGARHLMVGFGYTLDLTDCGTTGKLTGGTAAWGASISLDYKATFNMYGGTITGNSNTASSGGIGAIYVRPGKVSGTTHTAGATVNIYGGTISGNTGKAAGAIYIGGNSADLLDGILNIYGGTITGNNCTSGAIYTSTNATVSLSGKPVITENTGGNLNLGANGVLQVKDLEKGAAISVGATTARAFSTETDKDYSEFFTADNSTLAVQTVEGKLTLVSAHLHNVCADAGCTEHASENWVAWSKTDSLPTSGQYYLTKDVTLSAQVKTTGNLKLCLNGHTVTATSGARHLMVGFGYTLDLTDCKTTGKLTGGTAAWGASISLDYKGTFNMYGGTIEGNSNTASSGGIGAIYVRPGKVSGTTHTAGATVNIYGGTISGNTGKAAGAIYIGGNSTDLLDGILNIYGGTITGNNCASGAIYTSTNATVSLSGMPVITGNTGGNLNLGANGVLQVSGLEAGASIGVDAAAARAISTATDKDYAEFFTADNSTLTVRTVDGKLTLVSNHLHNVCADDSCTDHGEESWVAWEKTDSLPLSGQYYLTADVQLSEQVKTNGNLKLCLNGHTVTAGENARHLVAGYGCVLTLSDCQETGKLTGGTAAWGASISLDYAATFNMYGGTISGNENTSDSGGIGAIYVRPGKVSGTTKTAGGTMNLYGGTIESNSGKLTGAIYVGGSTDDVPDAVLNVYGGTLSDNSSTGAGGAISGAGNAQIAILGGKLENNTAATDGGAVCISNGTLFTLGSTTVQNNAAPKGGGICVRSNAGAVTVTGSPVVTGNLAGLKAGNLHLGGSLVLNLENLSSDAKVGISADTAFRSISNEVDAALAACFTSDRSAFYIEHKEGKLYLGAASGHEHCVCDGITDKCSHEELTWAAWDDATTLPTEGTYYLTVDVKLSNTIETTGKLQLCLNGHTVTAPEGKRHMNIAKYTVLELTDCATEPGVFTGGTQSYGASISIRTAGTMHFYGGKFSGNKNETEGGAIYLQAAQKFGTTEYAGAKFYMYGGEISGNTSLIGGGVSVSSTSSKYFNNETYDGSLDDCVMHIYGGKIVNNISTGNGGGVYTRAYSDSQILGGEISGNQAKLSGGGVYVHGQCDLLLKGGVIQKNSAGKYGGGVHGTNWAVIHLSGTPVRYNNAKESGGGVGLSGSAELRMTGSTISYNQSANGGGVISMSKAIITIKGGSITGNTATKNAGAIYVSTNTFFNMYGGTISYNKATTGHAGAIYFLKSTGNIYGGSFTGNEGTNGGALYANAGVSFRMSGGNIYGNKARTSAGGIYLFKTPAKLTGGNIYNNDAASSVGGMLLGGDTPEPVVVENVKFYDNQANGAGAVIVQGSATMNMKNCQITDNLARTGHGGGLYVSHNSLAIVDDTLFSGNEANNGGAYYATVKTNATLNNCVLENNVSRAVGGAGYTRGNLTLNDCIVRGNTAEKNGGGIATWKVGTQNIGVQPGLLVNNSVIESNTAGAKGGGLYLELGCNAQLTGTELKNNTAAEEGGALYAIDDLLIHGMTVTGNTSGGAGFAVYLDDNRYDGHSYHTGLMKMCGDVIVKDNNGGDLYLGPTTVISACAEDFGENTYIHVILDSGVVTNRIFGTYNYEGGNQDYILTYGTRSIDEPEAVPTQQTQDQQPQEDTAAKSDVGLYVIVGVVALVAVAAIVAILLKKKKPAGADKK